MMNPLTRRSFLGATGIVIAGSLITPYPAMAAQATGSGFVHPGILHTQEDLDRMRAAVAARESPIYQGFLAMAAHGRSSFDYVPQNTGQITSWGRGPSNFMNQAVSDSAAAYQNALMWSITGDIRHADKARDILDAWSRSLGAITGADGQLGTGLQGFKFVNAAEILRHSGYRGWPDEDIARCAESFQKVWYGSVSGYALFANGNWDAAAIQTVIAVGVFCEDRVMFEDALRYAAEGAGNGRVTHRMVNETGQGQESGRDQAHEQLGLALIANVAQVAWNQGVDLYGLAGNRILAGYEYDARYNLGYDDLPFAVDLDRTGKYLKTAISDKVRGQFQPIYELAYAHYVSRLGLSAPNTEQVIFRGGTRFIEGSNDDEPAWGTLTYARPSTAPSPSAAPIVVSRAGSAELPGSWASRDVGGARGATTFDGERFVLEAGGSDIGGASDGFQFAYLRLRGDGTITARVVYPLSSQYAKVGVMMRASLAADAPHASMLIQGLPLHAWSGVWTTRAVPGGQTSGTGSTPVPPTQQETITTKAAFPISNLGTLPESATPLTAPHVEAAGDGYRLRMPYWVRLERKKNRCTGSTSADGLEWTEIGSSELALGEELYAGLAACSCLGELETGTAAFDNVGVAAPRGKWSVPSPAGVAAGLRAQAGVSAIELSWSDPDLSARYTVKRAVRRGGPYQVVATEVGPVGFGVRTRYSDATGAPGRTYSYVVAKKNVAGEGPRSAEVTATMPQPPAPVISSAATAFANVGVPFAYLIRASNDPARFSAGGLPDGLSLDPRTGVISGIAKETGTFDVRITADNATATATGTLRLGIGASPPAPWSYRDIGDYVLDERQLGTYGVAAVRTPGITGYDGRTGSFTVRGAGSDLNVNGQGMTAQYAYRPVSGDYTLIARVAARANAGTSDQVGLIMTKSLSPFDQMAGAILSAGVQQFLRRSIVAGSAITTDGARDTGAPIWLRLSRTGTTFTAAASPDGVAWTTIGQDTIPTFGDASYYAGFAVCSRVPGTLNTTIFDNVSHLPD